MQEIINKYNLKDLGPQKNSYMKSFQYKNYRINIYKTGTITIQDSTLKIDKGISFKGIEQLEDKLNGLQ